MSEVAVYLASDLHPGEHVVLQPDYDSVVFDLAALREELAKSGSADHLRQRIAFLTTEIHKQAERLTVAEQRNAELVELTEDVLKAFNYHPEGSCYNPGIAFVKPWSIRAAELIKPTESGASE